MIRFQGFRLCLCSRSWLSCFFVQTQQTHEYKKLCFKASNKSNKTPLVTSPLTAILLWKKNKNQIKGLILVPTLAISSAFKLIIRLKSLESRLDGFKRKNLSKRHLELGALGPSSWPRGAYLGWPCIGSEPIWRVFRVLKKTLKKTFIVSDHCRFSPGNMSFLFVKTLVLHKFTPSILATSILPIIFSTSGWISSRNPSHRRVCRVGISDQGLGSPPWDISKMHHVGVLFRLQ